ALPRSARLLPSRACPRLGRSLILALKRNDEVSVSQRQRLFYRLGQPWTDFRFVFEPVDNHLDVVLDAAIEFHIVGQADDATIDASAHEAALEHVFEEVLVFPFLPADNGRQHQEATAFRQCQDAGNDLFAGLGGDGPAALWAMPLADPRKQDTK